MERSKEEEEQPEPEAQNRQNKVTYPKLQIFQMPKKWSLFFEVGASADLQESKSQVNH